MNMRSVSMLAPAASIIFEASAQQYVYPAKGQTPQQQQSDEAACYTWAVQQTGFDPAARCGDIIAMRKIQFSFNEA